MPDITWSKWGIYWFGEIDGKRKFQISDAHDGTYYASIYQGDDYYAILHKVSDIEEIKRFCHWLAIGYGLI
jgi:hypothetical protein